MEVKNYKNTLRKFLKYLRTEEGKASAPKGILAEIRYETFREIEDELRETMKEEGLIGGDGRQLRGRGFGFKWPNTGE